MSKYLDPKSDLVFKRVFGEHPHLLKSFLNAILPLAPDALIESLEALPTEQIPLIPSLKRGIVDVKCTDQKGRIFIVEVQIQWVTGFMQRMLFNAGHAYIKQLNKGEGFHSLHPVYAVAILNNTFDPGEEWYHHYQIVNIQNPAKQLKGLEFLFLELPKFQVKTQADKQLRVLWLRFLSEINEQAGSISADLLKIPEIKEACELAEEAAYSKEELEAYWEYWDYVRTEKTLIEGKFQEGLAAGEAKGKAEGLAQGEAKGKAEGLAEGKTEIAKNLLKRGLSVDEISKLTGLSVAEVENLKS